LLATDAELPAAVMSALGAVGVEVVIAGTAAGL
jgi:hypothetical protein